MKDRSVIIPREKTVIINAVGCAMVVVSHFGSYLNLRLFAPLGSGGVSVFLILSGYGLLSSYNANGLHNYWKNRFIKVLLPYWGVRIVYYLYLVNDGQILDISRVLLDAFLIRPEGPNCWYLSCAFFWYLIFWIDRKCLVKSEKSISSLFYLVICVFVFVTSSSLWSQQAFSFCLGVLLAAKQDVVLHRYNKHQKIVVIIAGCAMIFMMSLLFHHTLSADIIGMFIEKPLKVLQNTTLSILVILMFSWLRLPVLLKHVMTFVGRASYEIYLLHGYCEPYIRQIGMKAVIPSVIEILIVSYIMHMIILFIRRKISNRIYKD